MIKDITTMRFDIKAWCKNQLPSDYKPKTCTWTCAEWSREDCDTEFANGQSHCVGTPIGKIKDYCRVACGMCGEYDLT